MSEEIEEKAGIEPMLTRVEQMAPIIDKLMKGEARLSYSALSNFIESPKDFSDYKLQPKIETPAMVYGSMVHCLVLKPKEFEGRYFCLDDAAIVEKIGGKARATKAYKEWKAAQSDLAEGRIIVSPTDAGAAKVVAHNVWHNRAFAKIFFECDRLEQSVEWEYLNFNWYGFIDGEGPRDMFDLKTMPDANRDKVDREIKARKLYLQAVMYLMGASQREVVAGHQWPEKQYHIVAVDKFGGISVHTLHPRLLAFGLEEYEFYVKKFNHAIITEAWDMSQDFYGHPWTGRFTCERSGWMLNAEF